MKSQVNKRYRRALELVVMLAIVAIVGLVLRPEPKPVPKPMSPQQRAEAEAFFAEMRSVGTQVIQEAPRAFVEDLRNGHPYEVYRDLRTIKAELDQVIKLSNESDELEQELELLEGSDLPGDSQRIEVIEARLDEIQVEILAVSERIESL